MQKNRHLFDYTNIKKNPLFEPLTQLTQAKKVFFIEQLYKDLEAEISQSRTDSIKILDQLLNDIPKIVQDLKSKGFWSLSISDLEKTHPSVPILSNIPIPNISLNKNTLDIVMVSRRNLPKETQASYNLDHTISIPIKYSEMFPPIRSTTDATKISEFNRLFKHEMMVHLLIHELQHARDMGLNSQTYSIEKIHEYTHNIVLETFSHFQKKMNSYGRYAPNTFEDLLDKAQHKNFLKQCLQFDFKNLIPLYEKNQGRAKKHIIKELVPIAKNMILSQPKFKGTIEHRVISSQANMDPSLAKFNEKIMDGLLEAIASFPNTPKNMPKLTNNFFIQNADILQVGNKQRQAFFDGIHSDVLEIFYHPEIDLPKRIFTKILANLELNAEKFLPIGTVEVIDKNQQPKEYFEFDDSLLQGALLLAEISAYRTQDVDITITNALLDTHNCNSRFFYGDTFSKLVKTKFAHIRYKNQERTLEVLDSIFRENYFACKIAAIREIFQEIFHLDFDLVKGTMFDLTSIFGLPSYTLLVDGSIRQLNADRITNDICAIFIGEKEKHIQNPSFANVSTAFFGFLRDILCQQIFSNVCRDLIGMGLFVNSIGAGYIDTFTDSLSDTISNDQHIDNSEMFIQKLYDKVLSVKQDLIATLSFEQKFISISRNIFTASNIDQVPSRIIYNNASVKYLNTEYLQILQTTTQAGRPHYDEIAKACITRTSSNIQKDLKLIEMYRKTLKTYYDFCVAEYLKIHPKPTDAQSYVESCQNMIDAWNKLIIKTYNQDLIQVTDVTDKRIDNLTTALQPLIESFYDLCIGCVLTSPDFNQYVRTASEDATLNFQKLISEREILPKDIFVSYFDKIIKSLMSLDLTFFGSSNISNSQIHKFDPLDDRNSITETLESLLYALKFANALSEHYRLSIILGLVTYKIAEFDLYRFFCTKPTTYK